MSYFTINAFCERHGISRRTFYNQRSRGLAPETIRQGRRDLITEDAATAWRLQTPGAAEPNGKLAEIIALFTATALPDFVKRFGESAGLGAFYRELGTVLQALGVLEPSAAIAQEEQGNG
jgi:hypothetical protein